MNCLGKKPTHEDIMKAGLKSLSTQSLLRDTDGESLQDEAKYVVYCPGKLNLTRKIEKDGIGLLTLWYQGYRCYLRQDGDTINFSQPKIFTDGSCENFSCKVTLTRITTAI